MKQEEKARAYDEALAKAKEQYNYPCMRSCMGILEEIFPELKESEDEKIRKELIRSFKSLNTIKVWNGIERTDIIAWLEKQAEQKSAWSRDDEQYLLVCKNALAKYQTTDKWDAGIISRWLEDKLKPLRPQNHWKSSDEQNPTNKSEPKFKVDN